MSHQDSHQRSKTVLIVDDDDFSREVLVSALETLGVKNVQTAPDGKQAMKLLSGSGSTPDLVISDVFMPEMDGFQLIDHLVDQRFKGQVLLTSGNKFELLYLASDVARLGGLDLIGALRKPIPLAALKHAVGS